MAFREVIPDCNQIVVYYIKQVPCIAERTEKPFQGRIVDTVLCQPGYIPSEGEIIERGAYQGADQAVSVWLCLN